ncbi:MAG: sugar ABC transporter ATP-binding protein [Planctomycetes bacterium]|nr:sugar ABC transporter ATP-binding protein [Planctomycetota bacterium]
MSGPGTEVVLRMEGIVKDFPGVRALDHADLEVRAGEVHALIGENGAGKSTLMNVLAGRFPDYAGRVVLGGEEVHLRNPRQALAHGVAVIYQDLSVLPNLTVAENLLLGHEPAGRLPWSLDRKALLAAADVGLARLGFDLPLDAPVASLSHARQCLVEIARAIGSPPLRGGTSSAPEGRATWSASPTRRYSAPEGRATRKDVRVLVFDEPTASLGAEDVAKLFAVVRDLKRRGLGIVYITHRLAELPQIADRVTVLRDGKVVGTRDVAASKVSELSHMMLGRRLAEVFPAKRNQPGKPLLRVQGLTRPGVFENVSFELREGEILGLAGLVGSGRTEIARAILGADKVAGRCELAGRELPRRSPRRAMAAGLGMIQEDRKRDGAVAVLSVAQNLGLSVLRSLAGALGYLAPRRLREHAAQGIERFRIVPPDPLKEVQLLSGGNQQKVILGRSLAADPKVLILDEPTQGIDVGTKAQIYEMMMDLACEGKGILLISSEFIELVELCDRILVIRDGRLAKELPGPGTPVDTLFAECVRQTW